mgnify:CR=1 FL=1
MAGFPWGSLISLGGSLFGASQDRSEARKIAADQARREDRFNKNRIQWLVQDAGKAGINPLAALGSPLAGGFAAPVPAGQSQYGSTVADGFRSVGASVDRSLNETKELQNDLLRAQIGQVKASTVKTLSDATSRTAITNSNGVRALPNIGELPPGADPEGAQKAEDYSEFVKYLIYEPRTLWQHLDHGIRKKGTPGTGLLRRGERFLKRRYSPYGG